MIYAVTLHEAIEDDLFGIAASVRARAGEAAAERRLASIDTAIACLAELPHKGMRWDEIQPRGRRPALRMTRNRW